VSEESVQIAQEWYERLGRMLDEYWADPVPFEQWAGVDELFKHTHPDAEWLALLRRDPLHGRDEWVEQLIDWLDALDDWRVSFEEATDLGGDQALVVSRISVRGKGSGLEVDQRLFTVVTVRDGKIAAIHDYAEREQALAAAGP